LILKRDVEEKGLWIVTSVTENPEESAYHRRQTCLYVTTFGVTMNFEWDEAKNRSNIRKHGLDFADAEEMFRGLLVVEPDIREDYGERRWRGIGMIRGRTAAVIFTE
jgi:Ribonuclease toxin, BrnT, of type II toxin-antitoxin system